MTAVELNWIKQRQKEFKDRFSKKLEVDFVSMQGMEKTIYTLSRSKDLKQVEDILAVACIRWGADVDKIKNKSNRLHIASMEHEKLAMIDFCRQVVSGRLNIKHAASLVNRDRTVIYHFGK